MRAELPHTRPAGEEPARLHTAHLNRWTAVRHLHHSPHRHSVLREVINRPPRLEKRFRLAERPLSHRVELRELGNLPQSLKHRLIQNEVGVGHGHPAERPALVGDGPRLDRTVRKHRSVQRGDKSLVRDTARPEIIRIAAEPATQRNPLRALILHDDPAQSGIHVVDQAHQTTVRPDPVPARPERQCPGHGQALVTTVVQHEHDRRPGREPRHSGVARHQLHEFLPRNPQLTLAPRHHHVIVATLGHHHIGTAAVVPHRRERTLELAVTPLPHLRRIHHTHRLPGEIQTLIRTVPEDNMALVIQRAIGRHVIRTE